jgi:prevent-host-death family protein
MNVARTGYVGVRDLKNSLSRYLAEVREGKELVVTDHGHPIARLVPLRGSSTERLAELIATGEVTPATKPHDGWLPEPVSTEQGATVSDLVTEQRR